MTESRLASAAGADHAAPGYSAPLGVLGQIVLCCLEDDALAAVEWSGLAAENHGPEKEARMTAEGDWRELDNVEGTSLIGGTGRVRTLEAGEHGTLYEISYPEGVASPLHRHEHDSYIYLLEGHVTGTVDGTALELRPGQTVLHPRGVPHSVAARVDSRWLEFKAPAAVGWR